MKPWSSEKIPQLNFVVSSVKISWHRLVSMKHEVNIVIKQKYEVNIVIFIGDELTTMMRCAWSRNKMMLIFTACTLQEKKIYIYMYNNNTCSSFRNLYAMVNQADVATWNCDEIYCEEKRYQCSHIIVSKTITYLASVYKEHHQAIRIKDHI